MLVVALVQVVPITAANASTPTTEIFTGTVDSSSTQTHWRSHFFEVTEAGTIDANLDWTDPAANLNLFLYEPQADGSYVWVAQAWSTIEKPETITWTTSVTGTWKIGVKAKTGAADYMLTVQYPGSPPPQPKTYDRDIGQFATAEISPVDMVRDQAGYWYVFDVGLACLKVYDPTGTNIVRTFFTCGVSGNDDTHVSRARGLGIDPNTDDVWVADINNRRVLKIDNLTGAVLVETQAASSPGGIFDWPADIAVDTDGNAYVIDRMNRVVKLSPTGAFLDEWGSTGSGDGQLSVPRGIDFSSVGGDFLYITDTGNYRVVQFGTDGMWIRSLGSWGTGDGQFTRQARGIAVDGAGTVYASDVGGNRVVRWAADGTPMTSLGTGLPYYRSGPWDLFFGARGLYVSGDTLAVADMWNYRILLWPLGSGTPGQIGGTPPPWDGHNWPHGVALDGDGNVYVSDYWHQWIQKFAPDGTLLAHWGIGRGSEPGTLNLPGGIDVDDARGYLYIANRESRVIDRWLLSDGSFDARFSMPAGPVWDKGWPNDVAVDGFTGVVYAADQKNNQVVAFSSSGLINDIITTYGSGTPMGSPFSVTVDETGNVYVGDYTNRMVHAYDSTGNWLNSFSTLDAPKGLDVRDGFVYVLSWRVLEYQLDGTLIQTWGSSGSGDSQLWRPSMGIAVDSTGQVFIGDSGNHRVKVLIPKSVIPDWSQNALK